MNNWALPFSIIVLAIAMVASAAIIRGDKSDYELCVGLRLKAEKMIGIGEEYNQILRALSNCTDSFYPTESDG